MDLTRERRKASCLSGQKDDPRCTKLSIPTAAIGMDGIRYDLSPPYTRFRGILASPNEQGVLWRRGLRSAAHIPTRSAAALGIALLPRRMQGVELACGRSRRVSLFSHSHVRCSFPADRGLMGNEERTNRVQEFSRRSKSRWRTMAEALRWVHNQFPQ